VKDLTEDRAAKARDFIRIYQIAGDTPALPWPNCGPFRAAFYFLDSSPDEAREAVATAKRIFADAFGAVFGYEDIWTSNGTCRQYKATLPSGLDIVLMAKAAQMQDEDGAEDAGDRVPVAA
jgi:hypothetical protein